MITANINTTGAQPVYKSAAPSAQSNLDAVVKLLNVPDELKAGETYTIQVVANSTADVRAYFINLNYDRSKLTTEGIRNGDFFNTDSYSFPVMGEETIGLANAVYGHSVSYGDGVLAEVMFTATRDGLFSADMLEIQKASLVNSAFMKENITIENPTGLDASDTPSVFSLGNNFPNPFNPTTTLNFSIPENSHVKLMIYDILGRNVKMLVSGAYTAGNYTVVWDATDMNGEQVSAGVYFYTITAGDFISTKRMLYMK